MINLSLAMRPNPHDPDAPKKCYGVAQRVETMNMETFAKHIATHGSVYGRGDIVAILYQAVDCMREMLLEGKRISLGALGDFYISLKSEGADTKADYDPTVHIKSVNVNWSPGEDFQNLKRDAVFNIVASRREASLVIKAIKSDQTSVDLSKKAEDEDDAPAA